MCAVITETQLTPTADGKVCNQWAYRAEHGRFSDCFLHFRLPMGV